jgi:glycosyltransferase involved in cell wall biosynthesis
VRILHVAETAKGGVGTYLEELMPLQIEKLGASNIMALIPREHRAQLPSVGDDHLLLFRRPTRSLTALYDLRRRLRMALREFRPTVVHLHSTFAGTIGRWAIGITPRPRIIYTPHGWSFEMWSDGIRRQAAALAERLMAPRCDIIVAVSQAERRQGIAVGIPPEKIEVVLNGISAEAPRSAAAEWTDERLKVLFVGRLDRQKGIDTITAIASRHVDELVLRVIGASVVSKADAILMAPNVQHLGWLEREAVESQIQACDVVAMPSRWEGLSITALEAMRAGKAIVAFAVGGLPEAIEDKVTGRLVPSEDVAAFERALQSESREGWRQKGLAARHRFEMFFTSARMAEQLLDVYLGK